LTHCTSLYYSVTYEYKFYKPVNKSLMQNNKFLSQREQLKLFSCMQLPKPRSTNQMNINFINYSIYQQIKVMCTLSVLCTIQILESSSRFICTNSLQIIIVYLTLKVICKRLLIPSLQKGRLEKIFTI